MPIIYVEGNGPAVMLLIATLTAIVDENEPANLLSVAVSST